MKRFRPAICVVLLACHIALAAPAAPSPHWIVASDAAPDTNTYLRQGFFNKPGVVKAILLVAVDGKATVHVNGKSVGTAAGTDKAVAIDITDRLTLGNQTIGLKTTGPAAIMLELTRDGGQTQVLVTDTTWKSSTKEAQGWDTAAFDASAWKPANSAGLAGAADARVKANPFDPAKATDAYNSWRLATRTGQATDPKAITALPGFTVELIRSAQLDEDSWIALAFDPKGRLTIAKERRGLLRFTLAGGQGTVPMTVSRVEKMDDSMLECRGLLYAHGYLYVNANNSRTLYRLADTTPNDTIDFYDEIKVLLRTEGGTGHGRNHLALGPDDALYITHGNDVRLPSKLSPLSPYKSFDVDRLLASPWDPQLDSQGEQPPGGHVLRMEKDATSFELIAAGFRNPMGVAFNADGEMFTYDADMELDLGTPWYRPTRVNHIISGGEYGWRRSTAKWPDYFADSVGTVCDIGLGSPTAVRFGTTSQFPRRYRDAFFIGDWAYGRILAVHMTPKGSTYTGGFETFLSGRPLNVTDFTFGPDGALYIITGGRQTQSGLYRVRYTGPAEQPAATPSDDELTRKLAADTARFTRTTLEESHRKLTGDEAAKAVKNAMNHLGSDDAAIRFAARVTLEHQDVALWREAVLAENRPTALLTGLLALCRVDETKTQAAILQKLAELPLEKLNLEQQLMALRVYTLAITRMGKPNAPTIAAMLTKLEPLFPTTQRPLNHELCTLLVYLGSATVREKTLALIETSTEPQDLLHYLATIRLQRDAWSREHLTRYLTGLNKASHLHPGRYYATGIRALRVEIASMLPDEANRELANLLAEPAPPATYLAAEKAVFVRDWKLSELLPALERPAPNRSFDKGKAAFAAAQCAACHRIGSHVPGSETGPDLTAVASRFNRRDLLESITNPSKVVDEKYRQTQITTSDGRVLTGFIGVNDNEKLILHPTLLSLEGETIPKRNIASRKLSDVSTMPTGLLNVLTQEQILDLLTYLEAGGNADHPAYR